MESSVEALFPTGVGTETAGVEMETAGALPIPRRFDLERDICRSGAAVGGRALFNARAGECGRSVALLSGRPRTMQRAVRRALTT